MNLEIDEYDRIVSALYERPWTAGAGALPWSIFGHCSRPIM
jgi:hypothetical protein